ncbi:hypothetical protein NCG89_07250 [Spongiibacter taiwanensis]|uniref:response regulator n=1 Tax=Spongiibacter taiwanensis TaxID=1748242 RepID=UPI002035F5F1|nr:hypothetical protein [Spongiibacter taiwanensis]USA44564.1 hypothetical protein NCG89_07250 [Spongiibacter taiwanensis]
MKKVKQALLIDDVKTSRYLNRLVLTQSGVAHNIVEMTNAHDTLDYLVTPTELGYPTPELIMLELALADGSSWDFLDSFAELPEECTYKSIICVLSDANIQENLQRARGNKWVKHFITKPLTLGKIANIMTANFNR